MLDRLTLSHFRSHRMTRLAFDGRPVAIFGPNGAGKTNVLEAVSLLSPGRGLRRAAPEELARRPEQVGWKVTAEAGLTGIETWAAPGQSREVRLDGKPAPQVALSRTLAILWLTPAMDRLWSEGAEGRRRFFDRIAMSFAPAHAEAVLAYDKAMRERNRLLKDGPDDSLWFDALEAQMAEAGARIVAQRADALARLTAAQWEAETAFPAAELQLTAPEDGPDPRTAPEIAAALAEGRRRDRAAGRTLSGPHRADVSALWAAKGVAAAQCSTGEQKALLLSLILANARALLQDSGRRPILLLDEVAAHLDESRRAALYDEVAGLGLQAILTGTDRNLFAPLAGRATFLAAAETPNGTILTEQP